MVRCVLFIVHCCSIGGRGFFNCYGLAKLRKGEFDSVLVYFYLYGSVFRIGDELGCFSSSSSFLICEL